MQFGRRALRSGSLLPSRQHSTLFTEQSINKTSHSATKEPQVFGLFLNTNVLEEAAGPKKVELRQSRKMTSVLQLE